MSGSVPRPRPGAGPGLPCMICGERAILVAEQPGHFDLDCSRCGPLRIEARAWAVFSPAAMASFDRAWLSARARQLPASKRHGHRRPITEDWLHHCRLVTLLRVDLGLDERAAEAALARHPDASRRDESLLELIRRERDAGAAGAAFH